MRRSELYYVLRPLVLPILLTSADVGYQCLLRRYLQLLAHFPPNHGFYKGVEPMSDPWTNVDWPAAPQHLVQRSPRVYGRQ